MHIHYLSPWNAMSDMHIPCMSLLSQCEHTKQILRIIFPIYLYARTQYHMSPLSRNVHLIMCDRTILITHIIYTSLSFCAQFSHTYINSCRQNRHSINMSWIHQNWKTSSKSIPGLLNPIVMICRLTNTASLDYLWIQAQPVLSQSTFCQPVTAANHIYDAQPSIAVWILSPLICAGFQYLLYGTNYKTIRYKHHFHMNFRNRFRNKFLRKSKFSKQLKSAMISNESIELLYRLITYPLWVSLHCGPPESAIQKVIITKLSNTRSIFTAQVHIQLNQSWLYIPSKAHWPLV